MYIALAIILIIIGIYIWETQKKEWRKLKNANIDKTFANYLKDYYNIKLVNQVPPDEIFKALREAKKLDVIVELDQLISLFKTVRKKLRTEIRKFNEDFIEKELRVKRLFSHFLLVSDIDDLADAIIESALEEKQTKVKGRFKTELEKEVESFLNKLIEDSVKKKSELPELPKQDKEIISWFRRKLYKLPFVRKKKKIDKLRRRFLNGLRSNIKENKIYLSRENILYELIRLVFKDIYEAWFVSLQSKLDIKLRHIEIYIDKNVEIKKILELINKLHQFDKLIDIDYLERFITLSSGENERILTSLIHAKKEEIPADLRDIWDYKLRGGNMSTMLEVYLLAHRQGISELKIPYLTTQQSMKRNVEELIENLIKLNQEQIRINEDIEEELDELGRFQEISNEFHSYKTSEVLEDGPDRKISSTDSRNLHVKIHTKDSPFDKFVSNLIKASHLGLFFSYAGLRSYHANKGDVIELMDVMIKAKQAELDIDFDDCMKLLHAKTDIKILFEAIKTAKRVNLEITKEKLMDLQRAGGDMSHFIVACDLSKKLDLGIKPEDLEADLVEGRDVMGIIFAMIYAKNQNVKIDYHTSIKFDRTAYKTIPARIKWAVDPIIFQIEPVSILTKDGIEVKLNVNATVRGKYMLFTQEKRDEIFTSRIKETLVKEVERYATYNSLIESINHIAWRLYLRLNAKITREDFPEIKDEEILKFNAIEEKQNAISAYEILDVNIPSLEIEKGVLKTIRIEEAELEKMLGITHAEKLKHRAKTLELEAKANLIDSEAEINRGMAEAIRKGEFSMKDHLKKKIFDDNKHTLSENPEDI